MSGEADWNLPAADFHRRTQTKPIAVSKCEFCIPSVSFLSELKAALVQFEEILRRRDDSEIKYEWADIMLNDLTVTFSINWYDAVFFEERKEAYLVGAHPFVFQRFGVQPSQITISHNLLY